MVINLHAYGATVRLDDGRLASVPLADLEKNRPSYERALTGRKPMDFVVRSSGKHTMLMLAPQIRDEHFEEQIASYLKMTEAWEKPDAPPAHERHFLQKKKRAALFKSQHASDH